MGRIIGSFNGPTGYALTPYIDYAITQRTDTNKTYVDITAYLQRNSGGTYTRKESAPYSMSVKGVVVNNGAKYFDINDIPVGGSGWIGNGHYELEHNDVGHLDNFEIAFAFDLNGTQAGYGYASQSISVPDIPRASQPSLITWPNTTYDITIGTEVTIHTNQKADSFRHKAYLEFFGYSRLIAENIQYNTMWNTNTDATEMYKKLPNSNNGVGRIKLETYNGSQLIGTKYVEFRANITDANPTFNNFVFENTDALVNSLTDNNQIIVNKFSDIKATISTANKATAQKYATMSKYRLVVGSKQVEGNYSSSADVSLAVSDIDSNIITVYAIDSRGNSTSKQLTPSTFLNYTEPIIKEYAVSREDGGTSETVRISGNGTYWNKSFGKVVNDVVATYQFRQAGASEWINGTTKINLTKSNEKFSFDLVIASNEENLGFNIENSYEIKITISDKLANVQDIEVIGSGKPTLALHKNGIAINSAGGYDESVGGSVQVEGELLIKNGEDYDKITGKNIITCTPNADITSDQYSSKKYDMQEYSKYGNKLSISDGEILIGKGINYVIVSASCTFKTNNSGQIYVQIHKNNSEVMTVGFSSESANVIPFLNISPFLIEVKENDKISLKFNSEYNQTSRKEMTFMTVEGIA